MVIVLCYCFALYVTDYKAQGTDFQTAFWCVDFLNPCEFLLKNLCSDNGFDIELSLSDF